MLEPTSGGFPDVFVNSVVSAVVGFLAAWAAQSARVRGIEKDIESMRQTADRDRAEFERAFKQYEKACDDEARHHEESRRRQLAMLQLQTDIARKIGVQSRLLPDAIIREEL